ncbi:MAG: folate-binding protein, partial [Dermatophilaceae bacterium]
MSDSAVSDQANPSVPAEDVPLVGATPRSPLLDAPGAVAGVGLEASVATHYGDPMREQRVLEEGLGVVDLSNRGVVTVTGPDRLSWLHSLTTQHLTGLAPRESRDVLILTPKGHVEHSLHLVDDGETTWI